MPACRRTELLDSLTNEAGRAKLLQAYTPEAAATAVLLFYQHGREALGPPFLKVSPSSSEAHRAVLAWTHRATSLLAH